MLLNKLNRSIVSYCYSFPLEKELKVLASVLLNEEKDLQCIAQGFFKALATLHLEKITLGDAIINTGF